MQSTQDLLTVSVPRPLPQARVDLPVETNIRILNYGAKLYIDARQGTVVGQLVSPEILQKICNTLRFSYGRAAVSVGQPRTPGLLILPNAPFQLLEIGREDEDWRVKVRDTGQSRRLRFADAQDAQLMADLVQRYILVQLDNHSDLWRVDSPRIFCEVEPFKTQDGISAHCRYHVTVIPIQDVGLGIVIHISTSFFTTDTVADFFRLGLPSAERDRLRKRFERLSLRQEEQRGTLLYDLGRSQRRCYFDSF